MDVERLLAMFVSKDELRENMKAPWSWDKWMGATDGWSMLLLPKADPCPYKETVLAIGTIPVEWGRRLEVKVDDIRSALKSAPQVEEMKDVQGDCDECNGTGKTECRNCGQDRDCPSCDGSGIGIVEVPTGQMVPDGEAILSIGNFRFEASMMVRLLAVIEAFGVEWVQCVCGTRPSQEGIIDFRVGEARVIFSVRPTRKEPVGQIPYAEVMA